MYAWIRLFGDSEISIRIPSLAAAYTIAWLIYRWTRAHISPRAALIAALWLLLAPVPMWYSTEAKNSIFTALTSAWVLTSHSTLLTRPSTERSPRRTQLLCTLSATLAILTDFQTLLIVAPVWATIALEALRRRRTSSPPHLPTFPTPHLSRSLVIIIATSLALTAPLLLLKALNVHELPRDYPSLFNLKSLLWFLCLWMPIGTVLPNARPNWWPVEVASTGIILLPLLFLGLRRLWRSPVPSAQSPIPSSTRPVTTAFLFPLVFYLVASATLMALGDKTRIYQDRNIIVLMPWYPVVLAAGIDSIATRLVRDVAAGVVLTGALLSSILINTVLDESWTVMTPNPDWRSAARIVDAAPGRAIVLSRTLLLPLRYYSKDSELVEFDKEGDPAAHIAQALAQHPGSDDFYLISNRWWTGLQPDELAAIDKAFPLIEATHVRSLDIQHRRRGTGLPPGAERPSRPIP
jgi:4-amino-4-deoxy-L-arabinose transferase-like glycosyltransferase